MTSPGGLAAINTFQAENEVFVCHLPGMPVLPEGQAVQPELQGKCSSVGPAREARQWVPGSWESELAVHLTTSAPGDKELAPSD